MMTDRPLTPAQLAEIKESVRKAIAPYADEWKRRGVDREAWLKGLVEGAEEELSSRLGMPYVPMSQDADSGAYGRGMMCVDAVSLSWAGKSVAPI